MRVTLETLSEQEREALIRFYVLGQSPQQISRDLGLDEEQLRAIKERVKKAFLAAKRG
jgi:DNA-directed RNA polymerase specialized sigma24 family protein